MSSSLSSSPGHDRAPVQLHLSNKHDALVAYGVPDCFHARLERAQHVCPTRHTNIATEG